MELREKIALYGTSSGMGIYTDGELLSVLLGVDPRNIGGLQLQDILRMPRAIQGIGKKRAFFVDALQEVVRRITEAKSRDVNVIRGPEDVAAYMFAHTNLRYDQREHFCILCLNAKNHVLGLDNVSVGTATASVVHPREVFDLALRMRSASIILCHNHPSGDPTPSDEDIQVTERLVKAGGIMDVPVLDHVILGNGTFTSLKEKGWIRHA